MLDLARKVDFDKDSSGHVTWNGNNGEQLAKISFDYCPTRGIRLYYSITKRSTGAVTDYDYYVPCEATPCHYGGCRWWFWCPSCSRRCRILYQPCDEAIFACRTCHNLTYSSQQEYKSVASRTIEVLCSYDVVYARYHAERSPKKKAQLFAKLMRMNRLMASESEMLSEPKRSRR
jgi:hypothetical protein